MVGSFFFFHIFTLNLLKNLFYYLFWFFILSFHGIEKTYRIELD
jgi:hypothetical protein